MDPRHLLVLVTVAEHGSFSAAAAALHTVQSNVSSHIARLEERVGAVLVDRAAGRLTPEGEAVAARAHRVFAEMEAAFADVAALRHEVAGDVRLGVIGTTGRWLAPGLLAAVAKRLPGVRLSLFEGTSASLESQLEGDRLDLAVLNLPVPVGLDVEAHPLFDEDLVLVARRDDPLAGRPAIGLRDLAAVPLLLPMPGTAFRDDIDSAARAAGTALVPRAELDGVRLIASLTFEGYGPAILPATAVPTFLRDEWRSIAVRGLPKRRVGVAQRRRRIPSPPTRAVLEVLRELVTAGASRQPGVYPVT
jgi:DNA-binding transcriptional LysR family regulator